MRALALCILIAVALVACAGQRECTNSELQDMWMELNSAFVLAEYEHYDPVIETAIEIQKQLEQCEQTNTVKLFLKALDNIDASFVPTSEEGTYTLNIGRAEAAQKSMEDVRMFLYP